MKFFVCVSALAGFALALSAGGCGDDTSSGSPGSTSTGTGGGGTGGAGGEGGAGGGGGGMTGELEKLCQATYDRDVMCNVGGDPSQVEQCVKNLPCDEAYYRDGLAKEILTCLSELPCDMGEDSCFTKVADAQPDTTSSMAFDAGCQSKLAECQMAGTPFIDDFCLNFKLGNDSVLDQMTACFSGACDTITDCLIGVYDKIYATCPGK